MALFARSVQLLKQSFNVLRHDERLEGLASFFVPVLVAERLGRSAWCSGRARC